MLRESTTIHPVPDATLTLRGIVNFIGENSLWETVRFRTLTERICPTREE